MQHAPSARTKQLERRRLKAGSFFAHGHTQAWVARHFGVTTATTNAWHKAWKKDGDKGLLAKGRPGAPPRLSAKQLVKVEQALVKGPKAHGYVTELWTLERIATLMRKTTGVRYHPGHVWKILGDLGWSVQKPETRARERNAKKIKQWVRRDFPRIKKRGSGPMPSSDSLMKRGFLTVRRSVGRGRREDGLPSLRPLAAGRNEP